MPAKERYRREGKDTNMKYQLEQEIPHRQLGFQQYKYSD